MSLRIHMPNGEGPLACVIKSPGRYGQKCRILALWIFKRSRTLAIMRKSSRLDNLDNRCLLLQTLVVTLSWCTPDSDPNRSC